MIEDIEKYFRETPQEQILADWEKFNVDDSTSPTVEEFLAVQELGNSTLYEVTIDSKNIEDQVFYDFLKKKNIRADFYGYTKYGTEYVFIGSFGALMSLIETYFEEEHIENDLLSKIKKH